MRPKEINRKRPEKKTAHCVGCPYHKQRYCDCGMFDYNQAISDYEAFLPSQDALEEIVEKLKLCVELAPSDVYAISTAIHNRLIKGE